MKSEIGGYFELEYSNIEAGGLHEGAIRLNSGRNCLELILKNKKYSKIYLPYFICDVVIHTVKKIGVEIEYYSINEAFEIASEIAIAKGEVLLYVNYFGLKDNYIGNIAKQHSSLIIDNSQALFAAPLAGIPTFYSIRKFVGVPDGGLLVMPGEIGALPLEVADSSSRVTHLYKRKNGTAASGYADFKQNELSFDTLPVQAISPSTAAFLNSYDFSKNKFLRERNYLFLYHKLQKINKLADSVVGSFNGPLCFPLLTNDQELKNRLIAESIFVPTYWPGLTDYAPVNGFERELYHYLLPLPIDHRYTVADMERIVEVII